MTDKGVVFIALFLKKGQMRRPAQHDDFLDGAVKLEMVKLSYNGYFLGSFFYADLFKLLFV